MLNCEKEGPMTRKLLTAAAVIAIALAPWIGSARAEGHGGGGFHGGGFHGGPHHGDSRRGGFRGGVFVGGGFIGDPYFGAPYAASPPAVWYFCPAENAYYPDVPSCP